MPDTSIYKGQTLCIHSESLFDGVVGGIVGTDRSQPLSNSDVDGFLGHRRPGLTD
jgi:hypothetical protein